MAVHKELGPGLREGVYQRALAVKMDGAGLTHMEQKDVEVFLDGVSVGLLYLDHLVEDSVVVEVKALSRRLTNDEVGRVTTYVAATGYPVGLLLNFSRGPLECRRILPPTTLDDWKSRIRRHTWKPREWRGG